MGAAGATTTGAATTGATTTGGATTGAATTGAASVLSPMTAKRAPTATVESIGTSIESRMPATGDGISVSTLSVDTSNNASSTATVSPTFFNHRVTVPSVTLSPSAGMVSENDICIFSLIIRVRGAVCLQVPCVPHPSPQKGWGGRELRMRRHLHAPPS